jgi:hypothetical protein
MPPDEIRRFDGILFGHLWDVELTCRYILLPMSLVPVADLPPVLITLAKLVAKFSAGVVDTGGAL